jgi:DNA mismatch repair protein MutL
MVHRRIQVLPEHLANKIAAGEVIQRPESVVKELLENSLDAEAKHLTVVTKDGGKKLIQVVDDGVGMDEQDAVASFLRHATSKIETYDDLEEIRTYGFRGEALASIAAVAQVTMKTRRRTDDAAVVVQIDGAGKPRISREGREPGTSIAVSNLFYNVPARRKFLKSSATEFRHIYDAVQRVALSHPEISLDFVSDDETIIEVRPRTLQERVLDIFGARQSEGMVWFEERTEFMLLSGYVGKPTFGQRTRVHQYLFLNGRYIVNRNISHAVFSAYEHLLIKGMFPFFLLFLDVDPRRVDVNVHPSKMEAKFEDEQSIYRLVSTVVRKTLAAHDLVPGVSLIEPETGASTVGMQFTNRQHSWSTEDSFDRSGPPEHVDRLTGEITSFGPAGSGADVAERLLRPIEQSSEDKGLHVASDKFGASTAVRLWQLHRRYILVPVETGLMIIDQHVAHERVLYERALARLEKNLPAAQHVLFPLTLQLTPGDYALLSELFPYFEALGFLLKPFGKNTIVLEGIPSDLRKGREVNIIEELLSLYKENQQHGPMDARDTLLKSYSCKAAVKAGDELGDQEMRTLVGDLFSTKMPYVCPHGRPIVLKLGSAELDRRFGRL